MLFFGKKKKQEKKNEGLSSPANLHVIPDVFYGGRDPAIYHKIAVRQVAARSGLLASVLPRHRSATPTVVKAPAVPGAPLLPAAGLVKPKARRLKPLLFVGVGIFVVFLGAAAWFYLRRAPTPLSPPPTPPVIPPTVLVAPPPVETTTAPVVTSTVTSTGTASRVTAELVFPSSLLSDSADTDADSLTDLEEEVFGTDSGSRDTDSDGYYDGQEVFNLYNPKGLAPIRLVDSGTIQEYVNPTWKYRVYYPQSWAVAAVDAAANQTVVSAITGDFIEWRVEPKEVGETLVAWFARRAAGQSFSDLQPWRNRFEQDILWRKDHLAAYVDTTTTVFMIIYHPTTEAVVPFRHIMEMMAQSFRLDQTAPELPAQPVIPLAPTTTPFIPVPVVTTDF